MLAALRQLPHVQGLGRAELQRCVANVIGKLVADNTGGQLPSVRPSALAEGVSSSEVALRHSTLGDDFYGQLAASYYMAARAKAIEQVMDVAMAKGSRMVWDAADAELKAAGQ